MPGYTTGLELVLNACEGVLQIGVTENGASLCFQEWMRADRGNEILAPALARICQAMDIRACDFRRIACVSGPGSFTGIRLVLASAAGLRRTGKAMLAALNYLQALATSAAIRRGLLYPAPIWVLTHARRQLVHCQPYRSYGPVVPAQPLGDVVLLSPQEALQRLGQESCHVCGSALTRYPEIFEPLRTGSGPAGAPNAVMMPELTSPGWEALRLLARHGDYFPRDLEPLYVRPCDAVEALPEMAARQGRDGQAELTALKRLLEAPPCADREPG